MINNRQGGRRRGRGGQRPQNIGGRPDGNRQDNRQRGNAAQLLEKYKSMARDAQLAGDRVQTEYYLQFADHYFRILSENRARFEDQRRQRGDEIEDDGSDEEMLEAGDDQRYGQTRPDDERTERNTRYDRGERAERQDNSRRFASDERYPQEGSSNGSSRMNGQDESIPFDALPPAIGRETADDSSVEDEASRPRRRPRRPRQAEGEGEAAPAV